MFVRLVLFLVRLKDENHSKKVLGHLFLGHKVGFRVGHFHQIRSHATTAATNRCHNYTLKSKNF
jgi:L-cystine uptake protein TcyP (sodium:dicarboxylate symporter family)